VPANDPYTSASSYSSPSYSSSSSSYSAPRSTAPTFGQPRASALMLKSALLLPRPRLHWALCRMVLLVLDVIYEPFVVQFRLLTAPVAAPEHHGDITTYASANFRSLFFIAC
jgi:hypothetical protein